MLLVILSGEKQRLSFLNFQLTFFVVITLTTARPNFYWSREDGDRNLKLGKLASPWLGGGCIQGRFFVYFGTLQFEEAGLSS